MLAACGGAVTSTPDAASTPMRLEIYSWLTAGSEKTALDNVVDELKRRHPGLVFDNATVDRGEGRMELLQRMANDNPPDSFQVITGMDLRQWADVLESLDSAALEQGWASAIPKGVLESVSKNGTLIGVPLGIERDNTLFYNKAILQGHGVSVPTNVADFFRVADALKSQGVTPLSVSASGGWTIASHLFEAVLVAEAGPDFVESYLAGQQSPDAPPIQAALTDIGRMMDYANEDRATTGWGDAVKKVCVGEAGMLFLPDFVRNQFATLGCNADAIGYVAMEPAGNPTFVFVGLAFVFPKHARDPDAAAAFAEVLASAEGQRVFNLAKGSIPARTDVPLQDFDPISQMTMKDFALPGERHILGYAGATSSAFQTAVNPALQQFVDPSNAAYKDVAAVLDVLRQNYAIIAR
jgi:glucose/mannose transport system substrate-binding protein